VTTFAGTAGVAGSQDGTGTGAQFSNPGGLVFGALGNLFVSDSGNNTVRAITPAGVVTTVAGAAGLSGTQDGAGTSARFSSPTGIAVDANGTIYVVDSGDSTVRLVASGTVSTLAGSSANAGGNSDGTGPAAAFYFPCGIAVDGSGNAYVTDSFNNEIRMIAPGGVVTTIGGVYQVNNEIDGAGSGGAIRHAGGHRLRRRREPHRRRLIQQCHPGRNAYFGAGRGRLVASTVQFIGPDDRRPAVVPIGGGGFIGFIRGGRQRRVARLSVDPEWNLDCRRDGGVLLPGQRPGCGFGILRGHCGRRRRQRAESGGLPHRERRRRPGHRLAAPVVHHGRRRHGGL
jgi:hypothetical protein